MANLIEQQAIDFANVPIIQREFRASVHLEDWEDVLFWDTMIQRIAPGRYNYLAYSKADNGQRATGISQCMKYVGYTSKQFFVCVDSDMTFFFNTARMDATHYLAQTYTYSWENHYAEAEHLQNRFVAVLPDIAATFDFHRFLFDYSKIVFHPLLALLYCLRNKNSRITQKKFWACLPHQCKSAELSDNGEGVLLKVKQKLDALLSQSGILGVIDFDAEEARYASIGLEEGNAYLHVRGHNLYDLIKSIGHQLCSSHKIDFENRILNMSVPEIDAYWEVEHAANDLQQILL